MKLKVNEELYENDSVMAEFGRTIINQYLGWCNMYGKPHSSTGWASYCEGEIENSEILENIDEELINEWVETLPMEPEQCKEFSKRLPFKI